jgi:putative iron-dependent peroxidase
MGIFAQGTHAHHFLEFDLRQGVSAGEAIASFRRLRNPDVSAGGANLVIAFGSRTWRAVAATDAPADLAPFREIRGGGGRTVPATQHDAWLWVSGAEPDETWDRARAAALAVADAVDLVAELQGFTYRGGRDITGFVDGTANPQVRRAGDVALVPPGQRGAGGSHVLAMRWVHDLAAFHRLSVEDQQRVFGRTKADSLELPPAEKPASAHIARVEIDRDGEELEIFRRSVPYGSVAEHGLNFVAFSRERARYDLMLARMFGTAGDGVHDRLTDFSRPVAAAYYFAPSESVLNELAENDWTTTTGRRRTRRSGPRRPIEANRAGTHGNA